HAAGADARTGRRRRGRARDHVVRPVRGRRQLRRRHRRVRGAHHHSVPGHQPRRGPHLGSHGAMDGAIRFTQRDALAAVLITAVNIVAGLIIGVAQHGLDIGTAAKTYTILTVGEGLVTSIPALLVSMSGGLITTRAASESNLGEEVATQLLARS